MNLKGWLTNLEHVTPSRCEKLSVSLKHRLIDDSLTNNQTQHTNFSLLIFAEFDYIIGDVNIICIRHLHDLFQTPEQI